LKYLFQFCSENGGKLAEISHGLDMSIVKLFLNGLDPHGKHLYWIGLRAEQNEGDFVWSGTNALVTFTNWNEGEPNNNNSNKNNNNTNSNINNRKNKDNNIKGGHENCVHLESGQLNRRWSIRNCDSSFLFALCQKGNQSFKLRRSSKFD
jgi:hypothetical protein